MEQAGVMNWNDDRLDRLADDVDALRGQVEDLSRHMDERFEKQEARMTERFENQDARINDRFDRLQTSLVMTLAGFLAAFTTVVIPTVF
jgi:outer membrane murein-binding lipoprotein Lpp